ncbi:DNA-3-methyladenine glycosylase I [Porticoccus sp.]
MPTAADKHSTRCPWCQGDDLYQHYHDTEWGLPCRNDRTLFEFLVLESAQAGLAWITILRKRENYRQAFAGFDPGRVAGFDEKDIARLLEDAGIVRNRLKIMSAINNAQRFLEVQQERGSFSNYLWGFVDGQPTQNHWRAITEVPTNTALSSQISRDMKQRGFQFFGSTICYAYLQATGVVNDHLVTCFRHRECEEY